MKNFLSTYLLYVKGVKKNLLINIIFTPISWLTGAAISVMNFLRVHGLLKTEESPLPLISVGNLTYGGTNKTPFVRMLAEYALSKNIKVGIVTRGYSGKSHDVLIIKNGEGERSITGDEPLLLSKKLPNIPVAVARHRMAGIKKLKSQGIELVIADDAFQHRSMGRDVDIVLIDSVYPFGSGKLIPAGMLREKISALRRADIVVLTKSKRISQDKLEKLKIKISKYISPEKIFTSEINHDGWILFDGESPQKNSKIFAFSAIGSPESFIKTLSELGLDVKKSVTFRDHHNYSQSDLENLYNAAKILKVDYMSCTEKDLYNMPELGKWNFEIPLIVPKVKAEVNEREKFFEALSQTLRPEIIIASNGYGEDAIGVVLAKKFREKLPESKISAFPLVGRGEAYIKENFEIKSAPSVTPSGGVLKYSVKDLWGDMRAGLLRHVRAQLKDWEKISGKIKTPICVGDVYLILHTLLGSGARPLFAATAKTVYLSGHWRLERFLINKFTLRTWTRDLKSAEQLGGRAIYSGSPIMDLLEENNPIATHGDVILLLPGSRARANKDVKLLLDAAEIMKAQGEKNFRMILAPTLDFQKFFEACASYGWKKNNDTLVKDLLKIKLSFESVAKSVNGVKILLGLGGTANQLCAGLGIPVISIDEKGKRVQKKLLGDSEILVPASPEELASCALRVLRDESLYKLMSDSGRERMGTPGALDDIVKFACENLGWRIKNDIFKKFLS